mgnify:FL=1
MEEKHIGNIKISEDVIATLVEKAMEDVDGVEGLKTGMTNNIAAVLGKRAAAKGVGVEIKDNTVSITAHVIVKYGYRIPELAWKIQEMVKTQVEDMTGLEVLKVNFSVDGIKFPEEEKAPEKAEEASENNTEEE